MKMITRELTHPRNIVIVGGSEDTEKPGGKILKNLLNGNFSGELYVLNPKADNVQGVKSFHLPEELPDVDLAIIAISARYTPDVVEYLTQYKNTKAFIIISAGFSEESKEGKVLEDRVVAAIDKVGGSLIGPNCVGILTPQHHSIFTEPIPKLSPQGCDFISGSGATACFIMEAGIPKGLQFANVYSVGNSAQLGVEEILKHLDETFNPDTDSRIKLLYIETIENPTMLLKHAASLIKKGCCIAAVKAGSSEAGSRAASSHTGAIASSDFAVDALFRKAGIVRCFGREDLISVASVFTYPELIGKNVAIITHAGGPAVMLTDALSSGGLSVPEISGMNADKLKAELFEGSSVSNPIDFLATGTAEQLGIIIDYVDDKFENIDAMVVIFGTPGLTDITEVYDLLFAKIKTSTKPIYPVLPSVLTAQKEVNHFVGLGGIYFPDEVNLGNALSKVFNTKTPIDYRHVDYNINIKQLRSIVDTCDDGFMSPDDVQKTLDACGIKRAKEVIIHSQEELLAATKQVGFPLVMKVIGPVHKTDVGGVIIDIKDMESALTSMNKLMNIPSAIGVLLQPMLNGVELFAGVSREDKFGHMIFFGLGGVFVEMIKDVRVLLTPFCSLEVMDEIKQLRSYKIIEGYRGNEPVNENKFAEIISRLAQLVDCVPEISEMDLNPLLGTKDDVVAVDVRIRLSK